MEKETPIRRNVWAKEVKVTGLVIELDTQNKERLGRLRFETEEGDITYKPKKEKTDTSELAGIKTQHKTTELYTVSEFLVENDWIKKLAEKIKKEPQKLIISWQEILGERDNEEMWFKYLTKNRFNTIYWESHHKKEILEEQKSLELKYKL